MYASYYVSISIHVFFLYIFHIHKFIFITLWLYDFNFKSIEITNNYVLMRNLELMSWTYNFHQFNWYSLLNMTINVYNVYVNLMSNVTFCQCSWRLIPLYYAYLFRHRSFRSDVTACLIVTDAHHRHLYFDKWIY